MEHDTAVTDALHKACLHRHCSILSCCEHTQCCSSPCSSDNTGQQHEKPDQTTVQQHNTSHGQHVCERYVPVLTDGNFMAVPFLILRVYQVTSPGARRMI